MTSDTTPSGVCRASSFSIPVFAPWHVFDGISDVSLGTGWQAASGADMNQWVEYEYLAPVFNYKIRIIQGNTELVMKNFTVQYSDDGVTYQDATEKLMFEKNKLWHEYVLAKSIGRHKYWRLFVYDRYGPASSESFGITEVEFYGK